MYLHFSVVLGKFMAQIFLLPLATWYFDIYVK